jgi:REP element-mobilizing transposase RayT
MARPLRIEYPGAIYHVTTRGNGSNKIFSDDQDREIFLSILGTVVTRYNWLCHAYCLMDNHYHLMIETPDANLSIGMRQMNGMYTQRYNRRHDNSGHIFQGRFKAILVQKENYLRELCRYVVLNPVRVGLAEKPEAWEWSSYLGTTGMRKRPKYLTTDWILGMFSSRRVVAEKRYRAFVREGIKGGSPWGKLQGQVLLGEEGFTLKFKELLENKRDVKEIPRLQRYANRPSLNTIFSGQKSTAERDTGINIAHVNHGYTLKEIADHLGIHYTTVSRVITKKAANKHKVNKK